MAHECVIHPPVAFGCNWKNQKLITVVGMIVSRLKLEWDARVDPHVQTVHQLVKTHQPQKDFSDAIDCVSLASNSVCELVLLIVPDRTFYLSLHRLSHDQGVDSVTGYQNL